ncbi:Ciliary rootlet coiled-coil protein [Actinidia chinensis var. chinensis]|uniref:Ciliary rootlet coiled-coil protein n=1 Tax=Actinidia chinensis var. chinensis TaxID=1590841 RepID=A0A2R6P7F5_ACTCC|nr:Ciliary rootlet coiled-coil protein [Actinidia chinensis var. chinensis]
MDNQRSPLLTWAYYCQGKSMDELKQSLLYTTLELETTRLKAQEELKMRDDQLNHLKDLLTEAISERDQAQEKCHRLVFEKILLQQTAPISGISSIEDEPRLGLDSHNGFSSDDCEESIVSSPVADPIPPPPMVEEQVIPLVDDKPWPEKGKFLQAVMKAGPLLQTLLLAGPLPQWRHPPPPIESYQIPPPPVAIPPPPQLLHQDSVLNINGKRGLCESSGSPTAAKYQRVVLQ